MGKYGHSNNYTLGQKNILQSNAKFGDKKSS